MSITNYTAAEILVQFSKMSYEWMDYYIWLQKIVKDHPFHDSYRYFI